MRLLVSLVLLLTLTFAMIHLVPGDPVRSSLGLTAPQKLVEQRKAQLGLDKPIWQQYADYVDRAVHGDFGTSLTTGEPITDDRANTTADHAATRRARVPVRCVCRRPARRPERGAYA